MLRVRPTHALRVTARVALKGPSPTVVRHNPKANGIGASVLALSSQKAGRRWHSTAKPAPLFEIRSPADAVKVSVDGKEYDVPKGATVLQACEVAGIDIPRFCYHDRLSVAGNCRMCLVEVEKTPKPVASCAWPVMPGMKIKTDTPMVKKAREGVMEFLLANHPLDCPICDQGGECDLQDQSMAFGSDRSRFREWKRTVEDKNIGPLVKTVMTRCIHCTRCVRFAAEIAGVPDLGATGRGNVMEIGTYIDKVFDSELSGNVIDLCPVGALTSKPYAFTARPWELTSTESIDVLDAVNPSIRIDTRGQDIMRILPRLNEDVNEEWIGDKTRFSYDGLKRQRLDTPMVRKGDDFHAITWEEALGSIKKQLEGVKGSEMIAVAGDLADAESLIALKDLFNRLGSGNLQMVDDLPVNTDLRSEYLFNSTIAGIEEADAVLLVGTNPRIESPLIAHRIRKAVRAHGQKVFAVGPPMDLALPHQNLGNRPSIVAEIAEGKHKVSQVFAKAKKPLVIVGMGALNRRDSRGILNVTKQMIKAFPNLKTENWNGLNILNTSTARTAAYDLGFRQGIRRPAANPKFVYLLGADEVQVDKIPKDAFVVYQGHHGDAGANRANIVLPGAAYTEKSATYVNIEGRVQTTAPALTPLQLAREDWRVIRALSEVLGKALPYDSLDEVRARLAEVAPHFARTNQIEKPSDAATYSESQVPLDDAGYKPYIENYYMTNAVSRSSRIMAKASQMLKTSRNSYLNTQHIAATSL